MPGFDNIERVYILTPALAPYDAVGNDIRGMARVLRDLGISIEVYAGSTHPELAGAATTLESHTPRFWQDRNALLIYHHSIGWPAGQTIVSEAKCRLVIKHHNVTPPRFFEAYSAGHAHACAAGIEDTRTLANRKHALFWGDSQFNNEGLIEFGAPRELCRVLPPFHDIENLAQVPIAPDVVQRCKQQAGLKILFVGGLKPNKGHARLIRALANYCRYIDPNAVLILPGTVDSRLQSYVDMLKTLAARLGVASKVLWVGPVNDSQMRAYYFSADVFLCLSEHEGFCVPLLEAMFFRLPIITHKSTAIPETVGQSALLWDSEDFACITESLAVCSERSEQYRALTSAGWNRYCSHFSEERIARRFRALIEEAALHEPA